MPKGFKPNTIYRIIDANINRTKEGLRVCEEITRFILNSRSLSSALKTIRHKLDTSLRKLIKDRNVLIQERQSISDVGRTIKANEFKRQNLSDVFLANMQRVKESIRVLEEFSKLIDKKCALDFKVLRYTVYELEKKITKKIQALYHS